MSFLPLEEENSFKDAWYSVLTDCAKDTVFITPNWQEVWWNTFNNGQKLLLKIISHNAQDVGIVPLMLHEKQISFIGDSNLFDYMDFPHKKGNELIFFKNLWDLVLPLDWEIMRLESIPEDSATLKYLTDMSVREGYKVDCDESDKTPVLKLPVSWDEYLSGLRKKDRHELRRKIRRLEKSGGFQQMKYEPSSARLEESMECFFELMSMSSPEKEEFLVPDRKRFFKDIAFDLSKRSQLDLFFLEIDGEKVAGCICFDYGDQYLLYNSGYRTDLSHLSVGLLNKAFTIKHAIDVGKKEYNFLRGTERYKYQLGAEDRSVFDLIIHR